MLLLWHKTSSSFRRWFPVGVLFRAPQRIEHTGLRSLFACRYLPFLIVIDLPPSFDLVSVMVDLSHDFSPLPLDSRPLSLASSSSRVVSGKNARFARTLLSSSSSGSKVELTLTLRVHCTLTAPPYVLRACGPPARRSSIYLRSSSLLRSFDRFPQPHDEKDEGKVR